MPNVQKLTKQQFISQLITAMPVSLADIALARKNGEIKSLPAEGRIIKEREPLEYFEYKGVIALIFQGEDDNPFKGYAVLIKKNHFNKMPKVILSASACVQKNSSSGWVILTKGSYLGEDVSLSSLLLNALGVPDALRVNNKINHFNSPFDFRLKNLTTSTCHSGKHTGIIHVLKYKGEIRCYKNVGYDDDKDLKKISTLVSSFLEGQQMYNAALLEYKLENPWDIRCFGWYFEEGVLQQLFPDDYYENGELKQKYLNIFTKNAHLFIPISEEWTCMQISKQGKACLGVESTWLEKYAFDEDMLLRLPKLK